MIPPTAPAVEFVRVTRTFEGGDQPVTALSDVSLTVPRGAVFGVVGESGAGKSTLLRMMNGLDHPTSGRVLFDGIDLSTLTKRELNAVRHRIGVVFQSFNLVGNLTVRDNIALPLRLQRGRGAEVSRRVAELVDFVGLGPRLDHYPAQLSGGEKQRVAIARALATHPTMLLCDEPTSALDTHTTGEILTLLGATRAEFGTSIVLVTHELDAVKRICDSAAIFEAGELRDIIAVEAQTGSRELSYVEHVRAELQR
ncbi:methionine ABC transporter ATP-binding protein [Leucobacter aridicollis]|uniref:D-methionine transport system ATP-binding protein n=1 Tax=Leucobacter aridicollis TaxID=283878 RepID=A0A852R738_9MICO|nr:ATP-binding cassette domain-containing protein [Leucobacter aridicollis]MBL3682801.1 ATP-binding cassette domain-containing protein [Leucobacter aridicollis]NYD26239.1 D-methionine transport system ATP-binding protein [Leucobacter aridicollis]